MSAASLLEVCELSKTYRTKHGLVRAVSEVSFQIRSGTTLALVGESGCGKSTVALALLRLIEPDSGRVSFKGDELSAMDSATLQRLRQELSIVFQNPYSALNPKMKIRDIVGEPLKTALGLRGAALRERVLKHLQEVGLGSEHMHRYPHEFSGGQRQRIAVARALALEPQLLILDEPTAALDVSVQAQVLNLLRELQRRHGHSYLFISHNLAVVENMADEVMVMYLGRIVESGPAEAVFQSPQHPYTRALIASVPRPDPTHRQALQPLSGEIPSPLSLPQGCAFAGRCGYATDHCRRQLPALSMNKIDKRSVACFHPLNSELLQ